MEFVLLSGGGRLAGEAVMILAVTAPGPFSAGTQGAGSGK
jgi:hypothetical protein